jgi:hypothetical protein
VDLEVLSVPGCPSAGAFTERLSVALAGYVGVVVHHRVIDDELEAAEAGMRGSPTLLIDGTDPFEGPDRFPGLSCRLYRDAAGRAGGAPPVQALRQVLAGARP